MNAHRRPPIRRKPPGPITRIRQWGRRTDGNIAVDLAFIVPVILGLIIAALDFGQAFQEKLRLENAARAGAQYALLLGYKKQDTASVIQKARDDANDTTSALTINANYYCSCLDGSSTDCATGTCPVGEVPMRYIHVDVRNTYTMIFDYPGFPASIDLTGDADMRVR
jgi:Flp pilus assembly protein TadG